uniref:Homeobox-leucine zipper protein MERISTEM L1 n=1 Tax=Rhizophora mucronata TaxID=61149 RepID=A0A2P2IQH7_RHIMU
MLASLWLLFPTFLLACLPGRLTLEVAILVRK